jgi:hypothetical protein
MEGSKKGDALSTFVVGTCLQHGIGTQQDTQKSEEILSCVLDDVSIDTVVPIIFIINTLHSSTATRGMSLNTNFLEKIFGN